MNECNAKVYEPHPNHISDNNNAFLTHRVLPEPRERGDTQDPEDTRAATQ